MRVLGQPVGQCRLPMGPAPEGLEDRARAGPRPLTSPATPAPRTRLTAPVRITFLGGLGEIGRNCACVEQDGRIMLLDCGLMFPDAEMPGVDLVLPDFTWLRENADRVEGCIVTHGHEDHIGRAVVPPARPVVPDLRLQPHARAWPATGSRRPACSTGPS